LAIERILRGEEFRIDTKVADKSKSSEGQAAESELTYEELLCVKSFLDWRNTVKLEVIAAETTVFSEIHGYAGTVDLICRIDGQPYIVDFKTSKYVWKEYELQISAYRAAIENGEKTYYAIDFQRGERLSDASQQVALEEMRKVHEQCVAVDTARAAKIVASPTAEDIVPMEDEETQDGPAPYPAAADDIADSIPF
jgi:predicted RecB family nuclease